jgi:pimeloyl-ACP methyl ester carboxylesterase
MPQECAMRQPSPFSIRIADSVLDDIRERVRRYPWGDLADAGGWGCGTEVATLRALAEYWLYTYDWRAEEATLNRLPHFRAEAAGLTLHYIHVKGSGPRPLPILLSHGWPGSFLEFAPLVEKLAHPERFGGDLADSFDVVVPSLPGYGFSDRPARPIGPRSTARHFNALMTEVLGYPSYLAQGGDWGAVISSVLGLEHAGSCRAIHLNMLGLRGPDMAPVSEAEREWAKRSHARFSQEGAYLRLQATRPQSLSFAMMDSPVGIAGWILEKFAAWSDLPRAADGSPDLWARYERDQILTNIMLYLVTKSFASAAWMYRGFFAEPPNHLPAGARIEVPVGFAAFPDPVYAPPPRSLVEKSYNITRWTEMDRGGHFAALEAPDLFLDDLRAFARTVR